MNKIVKGFQDFYHLDAWKRLNVLNTLNSIAHKTGFMLLLLPEVEFISHFIKSNGLTSDIVEKEFFHCHSQFKKNNENLVLRPELTTGVIRHLVEKKAFNNTQQVHNIFTYGDCFRYENPQKGRHRQFLQWNIEKINFSFSQFGHIVGLLRSILLEFNLLKKVKLEINYLSATSLTKGFEKLINIKSQFSFCSLCKKRFLVKNLYRILDCKICQKFIKDLVNLNDYLSPDQKEEYKKYYDLFKMFLPEIEIIKKPSLTRGLDYYSGLVFEITSTNKNWIQKSIIAGGSYPLSSFFANVVNNKNLTGFGFAIGIERLILLLEASENNFFENLISKSKINIFIGVLKNEMFPFAYDLQQKMISKGIAVHVFDKERSFQDLLVKTINNKAQWLLIFGEEYKKDNKIILRKIALDKKDSFQKTLFFEDILIFFKNNNV